MTLLEEFDNRYDETQKVPEDLAKQILFKVLSDLLGRRDFDNLWDDIDQDVQEEILETNLKNIETCLIRK